MNSFKASVTNLGLLSIGLALSTTISQPSSVEAISFSGNTTGQPTFNRPVANGALAPSALSAIGTTVNYQATGFTVDTTGLYNFLSIAVGYDNYTVLYQNSFNPSSPLANAIIANDDFPSIGRSGFNGVSLNAGTNYFFVNTASTNGSAGAYTSDISGVGAVTLSGAAAVPFEFSPTFGLVALGVAFQAKKVLRNKVKK